MNYLHILSEDDNDDVFYQGCLTKITGEEFELLEPKRLRKSGGISEVKRKLPLFLQDIKRTGSVDNTFFLIAVDNDRSPIHPQHQVRGNFSKLPKADQKRTCPYCEINSVIESEMGADRKNWPIPGAIAVPVEMMESWQLLICAPKKYKNEQSLPIFPQKASSSARYYYSSSNVPDQLKDLVRMEKQRFSTTREFCRYCAESIEVNDLIARSPSFTRFVEQINTWRPLE